MQSYEVNPEIQSQLLNHYHGLENDAKWTYYKYFIRLWKNINKKYLSNI
jgi:hypothetical protein